MERRRFLTQTRSIVLATLTAPQPSLLRSLMVLSESSAIMAGRADELISGTFLDTEMDQSCKELAHACWEASTANKEPISPIRSAYALMPNYG